MDQPEDISKAASTPVEVVPEHNGSSNGNENNHITRTEDPLADYQKTKLPFSTNQDSLEQALEVLSIQSDASKNMFRALASIFQASQMRDGNIELNQPDGGDIWTILRHADQVESQGGRDVAALKAITLVLDKMLRSSSQLLLPAARMLADASRDPSWRLPLGESGMLGFSLAVLGSPAANDDLQIQSLRLIGNACADTDENRDRVVSHGYLQLVMARIEKPQLTAFAVPVLYNICCDYEPAQQEAMHNGLYSALVRVLENGFLETSPSLSYLCRLLDLGHGSLDASQSSLNTVEVLLRAATQPNLDVDDCASLVDAAVAHLQVERFQQHMVNQELFGVPLRFLIRSYFPQANLSGSKVPPINSAAVVARDPGEEAELSRVRKSLIQALSDVSAIPDFTSKHSSLSSPLIDSLVKWLSAALPQIQLCSCIVLGNLARSDEICYDMVSRLRIHEDLIRIVRTSSESAVVHSALGFLRNLALPTSNKEILGEAGAVEALTRFWASEALPQVSLAAVSVGRQLVNGTISNIQRLLAPLSNDDESPASSRTYLSILLSLFDKSDDVATKTEISRIVATILRCIYSSNTAISPATKVQTLDRIFSLHPNLLVPLGSMVSQSRYPVVRSEGWFALALATRAPEGCAAFINKSIADVQVYTALEETIRGAAAPSQDSRISSSPTTTPANPTSADQAPPPAGVAQAAKTKDGENAMILVNQLLQYRGEDMVVGIRRSALEELLHTASQQVERR